MVYVFALIGLFTVDVTLRIVVLAELWILFYVCISVLVDRLNCVFYSVSHFLGHILYVLNFLRILKYLSSRP